MNFTIRRENNVALRRQNIRKHDVKIIYLDKITKKKCR